MAWNTLSTWNTLGSLTAPTITAVASGADADKVYALTSFTVTVDDSAGITSVTVGGVACTSVVIASGTTVTATAPKAFGDNYGTLRNVIVNNGADSASYAVTVNIAKDKNETAFVLPIVADSPYYNDPNYAALATGDSSVYDKVTSPDGHTVTMSADGVYTLSPSTITQQQTFSFYIFDNSDKTAGTDGTVTSNINASNFVGVSSAAATATVTGLTGNLSASSNFVGTSLGATTTTVTGWAGSIIFDSNFSGASSSPATSIITGLNGSLSASSNFVGTSSAAATAAVTGLNGSLYVSSSGSFSGASSAPATATVTGLAGSLSYSANFVGTSTGSTTVTVTGLIGSINLGTEFMGASSSPATSVVTGLAGNLSASSNFVGTSSGAATATITGLIGSIDLSIPGSTPDIIQIIRSAGTINQIVASQQSINRTITQIGNLS